MFSEFSAYIFHAYHKNSDRTKLSSGLSGPGLSVPNHKNSPESIKGRADPKGTFAEVALKARAYLDEAYIRRNKSADSRTTETEWREDINIGRLDRRALYAIKSNQGGMFSEAEIKAASLPVEDLLKKATAAADP